MSNLFILTIKIYQKTLSPILYKLGVRCRFYPSCSKYAILAIKEYGAKKGIVKAYHRLLRCRPDNLESCIDFPSSVK
ncbi:MAG: membrane protein insertion efficiency factor YidD [Candidatus Paceibacterota bacterium]